jgi:hypothetical protein
MATSSGPSFRIYFRAFLVCLLAAWLYFFWQSFDPRLVVFSNDGPLGAENQAAIAMPSAFKAVWYDLNFLGTSGGAFAPGITNTLLWWLKPVGFAKFFVPFVFLFIAFCVWVLFRRLKLSPLACFLGGLAAALNSDIFSTATWGVGGQVITMGLDYLAIALLMDTTSPRRWLRVLLAGFAVGMAVMEGADIGAIFSLVVAAFVVFQALFLQEGPAVKRLLTGVSRVTLVAICAVVIAIPSLTSLISTNIKGVVGVSQDTQTKEQHWDWATQWSLPKREVLGLFVPGLFGFRMDTPNGGNYWGGVGRDPSWDAYFDGTRETPGNGVLHHSGGGDYAGVLVAVLALWAAVQSLRKNSIFAPEQKKFVWFWTAAMVIAVLLAFGRFAPFYRMIYALPYFSTIRNPTKYLHVFSFSIIILFGFGIHGLSRRYLESALAATGGFGARIRQWRQRGETFDRAWVLGSIWALALAFGAWIVYALSRDRLIAYLTKLNMLEGARQDQGLEIAEAVSKFSIRHGGWFCVLLAFSLGILFLIVAGVFSGRRAKWAGVLLTAVLLVDMVPAASPWLIYWNYQQKYETYGPDSLIQFFEQKPYEHRVAGLTFPAPADAQMFRQLYTIEWVQQLFQYYNIQSLDIIQRSRTPQDVAAFESCFFPLNADGAFVYARRWQLTNTRYLLGSTKLPAEGQEVPTIAVLNGQLDPGPNRFRLAQTFEVIVKPGMTFTGMPEQLTVQPQQDGRYAMFDFTGVLPRAKLYSMWKVSSNSPAVLQPWVTAIDEQASRIFRDYKGALPSVSAVDQATLYELTRPTFDPHKVVLLAEAPAGQSMASGANQDAGTVEFASYAPKRIVLSAHALTPAVLLLNDKYDSDWRVTVDGRPEKLLRANFIMRGVYVPAGNHTVEFVFKPSTTPLAISVTASAVAMLLLVLICVPRSPAPAAPDSRPEKKLK